MVEVSVIIVTYNSSSFIGACLSSIYEYTKGVDFEVVVVDNDSGDGTVDVVERGFPGVRVIRSMDNLGFAAGNNLGVREAKGEYLLFLNPDTELTSNAVLQFLGVRRQASGGSGVLGANLVDRNGKPVFCGGNFPSVWQQVFDLGLNRVFPKYYRRKLAVAKTVEDSQEAPAPAQGRGGKVGEYRLLDMDYVCGAAMFMRKEDFERVGGFDEGFFMYYEEVDLCRRMKASGVSERSGDPDLSGRCQVVPAIRIVHHESASVTSDHSFNYKKYELLEQSKYCYFKKHYGLWTMRFVKLLQVLSLAFHTPFSNQSFSKSLKITLNTLA